MLWIKTLKQEQKSTVTEKCESKYREKFQNYYQSFGTFELAKIRRKEQNQSLSGAKVLIRLKNCRLRT